MTALKSMFLEHTNRHGALWVTVSLIFGRSDLLFLSLGAGDTGVLGMLETLMVAVSPVAPTPEASAQILPRGRRGALTVLLAMEVLRASHPLVLAGTQAGGQVWVS